MRKPRRRKAYDSRWSTSRRQSPRSATRRTWRRTNSGASVGSRKLRNSERLHHVRRVQSITQRSIVAAHADAGHDAQRVCAELLGRHALAFEHESPSEPAVLPSVVCGLMNRDHSTEHLQLAHGCGSVDSEARISHQYVPTRILEAKEQLRASRRLVRFTQRRERFESRLDPAEAHLAASDADASQTGRPKAFAREDAEVTLPRTVPDVLRPDLPLDALDSAPPRDDCLDARHELDGVLRRQRRKSARRPQPVERRSRED